MDKTPLEFSREMIDSQYDHFTNDRNDGTVAGGIAKKVAAALIECMGSIAELTRQRDDARDQNGDLFAEKVSLEQFSGRLTLERVMLRRVCAEAYQLAGAVGAPEAALDNLSDAAQGVPLRHKTFLPVLDTDCSTIADLTQQLSDSEGSCQDQLRDCRDAMAELTRQRDDALEGEAEAKERETLYREELSGARSAWQRYHDEVVAALTARAEAAERERDHNATSYQASLRLNEHASKLIGEWTARAVSAERQVSEMRESLAGK